MSFSVESVVRPNSQMAPFGDLGEPHVEGCEHIPSTDLFLQSQGFGCLTSHGGFSILNKDLPFGFPFKLRFSAQLREWF